MMASDSMIIFGYGEFAKEIASSLRYLEQRLVVYALKSSCVEAAQYDGFEAHQVNLEDSWEELESYDLLQTRIICALDDEAENIFLTISLRDRFPQVRIIALATTQENARKLTLAGANKVVAELQTTSNLIIELLEKPVIMHLMQDLMDEQTELRVIQITLSQNSFIIGDQLGDLEELFRQHNVIPLAVVDLEMSESFIFSAKGINHILDPDDVLVVIGYEKEIYAFAEAIGGEI